jgi:hypothetical protein
MAVDLERGGEETASNHTTASGTDDRHTKIGVSRGATPTEVEALGKQSIRTGMALTPQTHEHQDNSQKYSNP